MNKKCLFKKLNNEKGAAAVLTLSVILVLTALGVIALMSGAANVSMGSKTYKWTKDFYRLDTKAEEYVRIIDEQLVQAEEDARKYVRERMDRLVPGDLSGDYAHPSVYNMISSRAQDFFNNYYRADWTYSDGVNEQEYSIEDYLYSTKDELKEISSWFYDNEIPDPDQDYRIEAYKNDISNYSSELFDRVYFYMLSLRLEQLLPTIIPGDVVLEENASSPITADYGVVYTDPNYFCTHKFNNLSGVPDLGVVRDPDVINVINQKWTDLEPEDTDIGIFVRVNQTSLSEPGNPLDDPKKVHVYLNVIKPDYETVLKYIYSPIKGNPIWANALSVQGDISFANNADVTVRGDVYASGSGGISVRSYGNVEIEGNVYTNGDLQITGNGGKLRVSKNNLVYDAKNCIYNNNGLVFEDYFDDTTFDVDKYTSEDGGGRGEMQFIYKDCIDKGNVYCKDLRVGVNGTVISGAELIAEGNIWTSDDIQMDGRNSTIRIGNLTERTYYVGVNIFSAMDDPNESSSVINNYPYDDLGNTDSNIILNSDFYIPGVAFHEFSDGYYKSLESAASRKSQPNSLINAYLYRSGYGSNIVKYHGYDSELFELLPTDDEGLRRLAFKDFIDSQGGIRTNILTQRPINGPDKIDGFIAEIALIHHNSGAAGEYATLYTVNPLDIDGEELEHSNENNDLISQFNAGANDFLMDIFRAKTQKLGTSASDGNFDYFVDKSPSLLSSLTDSELINVTSSGTLDLQNYHEGVVFCDGNLTIRDSNLASGTNTFKGAIICTGDVIIENGVTIIYDEGTILNKLKFSAELRMFFEKGERGLKVTDYEEYSTTSGTRIFPRRYKVRDWVELNDTYAP